ncbi:MAG: molybdopterin-dependent oxidoreductase, partial [Minwuiales bacterium]|nr:molybdopterin-dependent oxidoreductase [Minwuiales bacterium]
VSEQFLTDTAQYADIVLPATTQLEQEDIMFSWGHFYLSYNNRAIEPLGEAVPNTELFRCLAATMGFDDPFFRRTDREMIEAALDWSSPALEGITLDALRETGYARLNLPSAEDYAPHREGNFLTPSGKCEFKASMAENGDFVLPLFRQGSEEFQSGEPVDPLPHYIPPREARATDAALAKRYPLNILSPKSHAFMNSSYGNMAQQLHHAGEQGVLISPADARDRNIGDGMPVLVSNDRGSFQAIARIDEDVMPGVVVAPLGYWRKLSAAEATVQAVNSGAYADLGRAPTFSDNLVEVAPVAAAQAAE